jgi:hypothetical protein
MKAMSAYPDLGVYLQPDPMHRSSAESPGPQAYAYASGRPLVLSDPLGLRAGERFRTWREASIDGLKHALWNTLTGPTMGNGGRFEFGGYICEDPCSKKGCDYYWPKLLQGNEPEPGSNDIGTMGLKLRQPAGACTAGKAVRTFHSHPTNNGPSGTVGGMTNIFGQVVAPWGDRSNPLPGGVVQIGGTVTFYGPSEADSFDSITLSGPP